MTEVTPPCINLDHSYSAHSLREEEVVHSQQLADFKKIVGSIVNRAKLSKKQDCNELDFDRSHDAITVHGQRGVGKTTFMLSAIKAVTSTEYIEKEAVSICPLGVIDPTLMGGRENILLIILQKIKERVERSQRQKVCDPQSASECKYARWRKKLKLLGEGLQTIGEFIDGNVRANKSHEVDPQLWLSDSLSKAKHGAELERDFHDILHDALNLIGKDAFIIGVDDVDTRFEAGWPVLETIRKYLTSPKLVVVLSGDLELYSELVRQAQYKMFSFDFKSQPPKNSREYRIIEDLIEQYLMKILPPQNHLKLNLMHEYAGVMVTSSGDKKTYMLQPLLQHIVLKEFCAVPRLTRKLFVDALLRQPVRSLLRFLNIYESVKEFPADISDNLRRFADYDDSLVGKYSELYSAQLQRFGLSFEQFKQITTDTGISNLVLCLFYNRMAQTKGLALQPRFSESWQNAVMYPINAAFLAEGSSGGLAVSYFLRGCCFFEALSYERDKDSVGNEIVEAHRHEGIEVSEFLHLEISEPLAVTGRRLCGILDYLYMPFKSKSNFEKIKQHSETALVLPLLLQPAEKRAVLGVSVLPLVGLIGDLLNLRGELGSNKSFDQEADQEDKADGILLVKENEKVDSIADQSEDSKLQSGRDEKIEKKVRALLKPLMQLRNYPKFGVAHGKFDHELDAASAPDNVKSEEDELVKLIANWLQEKNSDSLAISPAVIAQAATRFRHAMQEVKISEVESISAYLQRSIVTFLHALLLEECLYEDESIDVSRNNLRTSPRALFVLYSKVVSNSEVQCHFSRKVITCPLWWVFMDVQKDSSLKELTVLKKECKQEFSFLDKLNMSFSDIDISLSDEEIIEKAYTSCKTKIADIVAAHDQIPNKDDELAVLTSVVTELDSWLEKNAYDKLLEKRNSVNFIKYVLPTLRKDYPSIIQLNDSFKGKLHKNSKQMKVFMAGLNARDLKNFSDGEQ